MGMMIRRRPRIRYEEGVAQKVAPVPSIPEDKKPVADSADKNAQKGRRKRKDA